MKISVVIPAFNEEEVISQTLHEVHLTLLGLEEKKLCSTFEILVINDGSEDATAKKVKDFVEEIGEFSEKKISHIYIYSLVSNQGQMKSLEEGLKRAEGDCIFTLDADLQDPPELMEEMLNMHIRSGIPCIQAVRKTRAFDSRPKRLSAFLFYKTVRVICNARIIEQAADFRLLARREAKILANFPSEKKAFRLLIPLLKIPTATIEFDRKERAAGISKYKYKDQIAFAWDCIFNFNRFRKLNRPFIE